MINLLVIAFLALASLFGAQAHAAAQERFALVVGNANYTSVSALPNPARDADAMSNLLESAGFEVTRASDLGQAEMRRAVRDFADKLAEKGEDTVALVYFAGHGLQIDGQNYLVPVDAEITRESDVALEGVRLADLLNTLDGAPSKTRIVILDACRNNPFEEIGQSAARGLAIVNAPAGSVIAYSTSPGATAEDGEGDNSPFTAALVEAARQPGQGIETVFQKVRLAVHRATRGRQTPWEVTALTEPFQFFPGEGGEKTPAPQKTEEDWQAELRGMNPRDAYETVIVQNNVIVYNIFVTLYADTHWGRRIRGIMDRRLEMEAWFDAVTRNTAAAFEAFLKRYPESDLTATAERLTRRAEERELQAANAAGSLGLGDGQPAVRTVIKEVEKPVIRTVIKEVEKPVIKTVVKEVVKEVKVPVEVIREVKVPGPVRTVVKEVPGPVRTVVKEVPGPVRTIVKEVPGPVRIKTVVKTVRVPCNCGGNGGGRGHGGHGQTFTPQFSVPPGFRLR